MFSGQKTDFPAVNGADVKPEAANPCRPNAGWRNETLGEAVRAASRRRRSMQTTSDQHRNCFRQEPNIRPALRADAQAEIFSAAIRPSCACAAATRLRFPARELTKFAPRAAVY